MSVPTTTTTYLVMLLTVRLPTATSTKGKICTALHIVFKSLTQAQQPADWLHMAIYICLHKGLQRSWTDPQCAKGVWLIRGAEGSHGATFSGGYTEAAFLAKCTQGPFCQLAADIDG